MHFRDLAERSHLGLTSAAGRIASLRVNRIIGQSGKKKGGGTAPFVRDKWHNCGQIHVTEQ